MMACMAYTPPHLTARISFNFITHSRVSMSTIGIRICTPIDIMVHTPFSSRLANPVVVTCRVRVGIKAAGWRVR